VSDLGDQIQDEIDAIKALDTAAETPDGQLGDDWDDEYESLADAVRAAFDDAAPDTIRNAGGEITADVNNDLTNTQELSVTGSNSDEGYTKTLVETLDLAYSASVTADLLPTHDRYRLEVSNIDNSSGGWGLRVNGNTGTNYDYISLQGTTSGATEWKLGATGGKNPTGNVIVSGKWISKCTHKNNLGAYDNNIGGGGEARNVSSPLTSITIFHFSGSNFQSGTIHLIGEDMVAQ
jgi:hypothetical protein